MKQARLFLSLLLIAALAFGAGIGTYAWFTSQAASANNVFTAGTLIVGLNGQTTTSIPFAISGNLQPGQTVTRDENGNPGYATIEIVNNGNLDLAYFDNFQLSGNDTTLAEAIYFKNWKNSLWKVNADGTITQVWEDQFIVNGNASKYPYYSDTVDANKDGKVSLAEWLHARNTGMGIANGWDFGGLKPGCKFVQQFELAFDENAGNTYQGKTLEGSFKVFATQTNAQAMQKLMADNQIPSANNAVNLQPYVAYRLNQQ